MSQIALSDQAERTTIERSDAEHKSERRRWIALAVLCLGQLMMVLDATIVNVALPSIQRDLHFSQGNLTWVIDAYLITFGGFLLLAGRMGDLVGRKKVFLSGLVLFTAASIFCGLASQPGDADRRALRAGDRRRRRLGGDPRDHRHRVPRESRAGEGDGHVRVRLRRGRLDRAARRRRADAVAELALDLLRERADRRGHVRARLRADRGEPGHRPRRRRRRRRVDPDHARDDARRLRDRKVDRIRPALRAHARRRRGRFGAARLLLLAGVAHLQPDHAAADPAVADADGLEPRPRTARDGDVLGLLPRRAVPRARARLRRDRHGPRVHAADDRDRRVLDGYLRTRGRPLRRTEHARRRPRRDRRRPRAAGDGRRAHRLLPGPVLRVPADRDRRRRLVPAAA